MTEDEKRRYPRVQVNRPGRVRLGDGPESTVQVIDISAHGAMLFYSAPVALGTAIELRFHLNTGKKVACVAYGEVRRYFMRGQSHIVGMEFSHFGPDTGEAIQLFIEQKSQTQT